MSDGRFQLREESLQLKKQFWFDFEIKISNHFKTLEPDKRPQNFTAVFELPLCIGYSQGASQEHLKDGELNAIVDGVLSQQTSYKKILNIYLHPNPKEPKAIKNWKEQHEKLNELANKNSCVRIIEKSEWRETESWKLASQEIDNYLKDGNWSTTAMNILDADVKNPTYAKFPDPETHIKNDAKDCVSWFGVTDKKNIFEAHILIYPGKFSQLMDHVMKSSARFKYDASRSVCIRMKCEYEKKLELELDKTIDNSGPEPARVVAEQEILAQRARFFFNESEKLPPEKRYDFAAFSAVFAAATDDAKSQPRGSSPVHLSRRTSPESTPGGSPIRQASSPNFLEGHSFRRYPSRQASQASSPENNPASGFLKRGSGAQRTNNAKQDECVIETPSSYMAQNLFVNSSGSARSLPALPATIQSRPAETAEEPMHETTVYVKS